MRGLLLLLCLMPLCVRADLVLGVHTEEPAPAVAKLLQQATATSQEISIQVFSDVSSLGDALTAGEVDLALLEGFSKEVEGISLVASLYPSVLHILYRGDIAPANVAELFRGKKLWAGAPGGIGHRLATSLAADFGLAPDEFELLADPWTTEPDIYFIFGGILAPDALSRLKGFRLFSLGETTSLMRGSIAEGVSLRYPQLQPFVLPAQLYPALRNDATLTLAVSTLLVARDSLSETAVYELARAVEQVAPQIAASYPLAGVAHIDQAVTGSRGLVQHPGALRYRDKDLPGLIERYAEILGFMATVMLAAGSLLLALRRHRQQSRKDRLDGYYEKLLNLRTQLPVDRNQNGNGLATATEVRETQAEVMALVVDERIDTDGALLAFLALSNQILAEVQQDAPVALAAVKRRK